MVVAALCLGAWDLNNEKEFGCRDMGKRGYGRW